jgi:hypothetical protein
MIAPRVRWGNGNEMHIQYWKKSMSILAKATQVSDVAHGPLVYISTSFDKLSSFIREHSFIHMFTDMNTLTLYKFKFRVFFFHVNIQYVSQVTKLSNTWSLQSCTLKVQPHVLSFHYWIYFVFSSFHCIFIFSVICFTLHNCIIKILNGKKFLHASFYIRPNFEEDGDIALRLSVGRPNEYLFNILRTLWYFINRLVMNRRRPLLIWGQGRLKLEMGISIFW